MANKRDTKHASLSISIGGMTCASCAANVEKA
jgi:copper chaperone CopZ